jgi:hypothetical protein
MWLIGLSRSARAIFVGEMKVVDIILISVVQIAKAASGALLTVEMPD